LFLCATPLACSHSSPQAPLRDVLTIGAPEAGPGTEIGIRQLSSALSLEGLTQLNADGRVLPRLAQTWKWEEGGRKLRVALRGGITFHDGTNLTAPLVATLLSEAIARPSNRAQYSSLNAVDEVKPDGPLELVFNLSHPSAFLPEDLELPIGIKSNASDDAPLVGTGPFKVLNTQEQRVELESYERYYAGAPQIRRVVLQPFETLRTAWTSLLRGEIDMVTNVPPEAAEFVGNDAVQVVSFARKFQFLVGFNLRKPPFNSPTVRRALNLAVDREELIRRVLQGRASASTGPIWPQFWAYDKTVTAFGFDPSSAVSMLEGAGLHIERRPGSPAARIRFTCLLPANYTIVERVALELQRQLYNVGVDMQFEVVTPREFDARIREGNFEAMLIDMISGPSVGRIHNFWRSAKYFRGLNVFGYENAEAERLFTLLASSINEAAVRSATSRLQNVLLQDPPALFLAWTQSTRGVRREFEVVDDPGRDPLYTIWRWAARPDAVVNGE
jgi:peptide/nickel transport system substrate-binding protein